MEPRWSAIEEGSEGSRSRGRALGRSRPRRASGQVKARQQAGSQSESFASSSGCPQSPAVEGAAVEDLEGGEELEFLVEAAGRSRPVDGPDQGFCLFAAGLAFQALLAGGDAETELRRGVALRGILGHRDRDAGGRPRRPARPPAGGGERA